MKRSMPSPAIDRLRQAFKPPESFGSASRPSLTLQHLPPAASLRAEPDAPDTNAPGLTTHGSIASGLDAHGPIASGPIASGPVGFRPTASDPPVHDSRAPDRPVAEPHDSTPHALDLRGLHRPGIGWAKGGRFDPGLPGVRALALVGILAALAALAWFWWSRPEPAAVPQPVVRPAARPAALTTGVPVTGVPGAGVPGSGTPGPAQPAPVIDVAGKVRHPGVVTLPSGARVIDAIKKAGGLRPGAKTGTLNLARRVVDGEQILVGASPPPESAVQTGSPGVTTPAVPIDLNTATAAQLDQLPGVGPVLAQRIVDHRTQHGAFRSVDELRQVSGIGDAKFADVKGLVTI
jgi:competence protein ComEA